MERRGQRPAPLLKGMSEQIRTGKIFAEFGSNQSGGPASAADEMKLAAEAYRDGQIKTEWEWTHINRKYARC
jgi:hypothetical protein